MEKMSIFHFFLILMKLKTNDYLAIPKQNVNKFFKKFELFARYRWLWVIDGKNLNFLVCPILIKLEMHAVLVILKQNMNRFFKKIVWLANRLSFLLQECGHIWKSRAFLFNPIVCGCAHHSRIGLAASSGGIARQQVDGRLFGLRMGRRGRHHKFQSIGPKTNEVNFFEIA